MTRDTGSEAIKPEKSATLENSPPASKEDLGSVSKISIKKWIKYLQCPVVVNDKSPSGEGPW